jgi:predicted CXXCH cytochrome family protein
MNARKIKVIGYGALLGALLAILAFATLPTASAAPLRQDATPVPNAQECTGCHEGLRGYWEQSAHGYALADPAFQEAWTQQGSPQECLACHTTNYDPETGEYTEGGVGCLTCHSPVPSNHPDTYMPTDVSSRLCGDCHLQTFNEWEISEHGQQGMTCNQCHNPHTAELRVESSQELCNSCHNTEGHYYSFTGHAKEGLLCTDCHLQVNDSPDAGTMGHGERIHTFKTDLETCNDCHLSDMHAEADTAMTGTGEAQTEPAVACYPAETTDLVASTSTEAGFVPARQEVTAYVSPTPSGPGPLVYILPAGFGLIFGTMLAPWIERLAKRRREEKGDK